MLIISEGGGQTYCHLRNLEWKCIEVSTEIEVCQVAGFEYPIRFLNSSTALCPLKSLKIFLPRRKGLTSEMTSE